MLPTSPSSSSSINYSIPASSPSASSSISSVSKKNYIYERREDDKGRLVFLVGEGNQENDLIFGIRQIYNDHEHFNKAKKFDVLGPNTFVIGYQKTKNRSLWLLSTKGINQAKKKAMLAINYGRTDNNEFSRDSSNEDDDDILATSNKRKSTYSYTNNRFEFDLNCSREGMTNCVLCVGIGRPYCEKEKFRPM